MRVNNKLLPIMLLPFSLLVGCGGGGASDLNTSASTDDTTDSGDSGDTDDNGGTTIPVSDGVSYLPLMINETNKFYSGLDFDNLFKFEIFDPELHYYLINPVDSATLEPLTTAVTANYQVTVDGVATDALESFSLLQPVIGTPVELHTALVFDVSGSMTSVDM